MITDTLDQTKYMCGFCHTYIRMGATYCVGCNEYKGALTEAEYAKFVGAE